VAYRSLSLSKRAERDGRAGVADATRLVGGRFDKDRVRHESGEWRRFGGIALAPLRIRTEIEDGGRREMGAKAEGRF